MQLQFLICLVIFFDMFLCDIQASHLHLDNRSECLVGVVDEQERESRAEHFALSAHDVVHAVVVLASMVRPLRQTKLVLLEEVLSILSNH